ncbi:MAG: molybdopterin oxidoreductase family protein [Gammaproteobacteria bacterium]|nr:molybdopterin oxidoreductase family protein [Gammaproteobacteria bacterium]MBU1414279.1 molybdopterin oxidoreductase family protein [Gammaproteobacteria bacterium]
MTIHYSVCPLDCPSACALDVELDDAGRVKRLHGAKEHPHTQGIICAKVARYPEILYHPQRVATPLKRVGVKGEGKFAAIGWDEALDEVAERFKQAADRFGPETVWPYQYAGTMGLVMRNSIERLRQVMGYSNQLATICSSAAGAGWLAGVGTKWGTDTREMAKSDLIVIWGTNVVATQVQVMTFITQARRERGAKLVVVDPYRNATAKKADIHLMLRPGTDGALAAAVMHVLLKEGLADREYLARLTDFGPDVAAHLDSRTPEWAAEITGLSVDEIVSFARLYGSTKKSFLRLGFGFTRQRNGAVAVHAVSCLPAVTGAWQVEGGGALMNDSDCFRRLKKHLLNGDDAAKSGVRTLDMSRIGAVLTGDRHDIGNGPPVTAMLIQNTNPMVVAPDSKRVREGFSRDDLFVCVHEQRMSETALMADIVLPATTFLEHDDLYSSYGTPFLQVAKAVIAPMHEARSNHEVIRALAKRLGARHPGFDMTAWELIDATLAESGFPNAEALLQQRWLDLAPDFDTAHFLNGFGHADRRFRFKPEWGNDALPAFPDHAPLIDAADDEHPFRLVTAPAHSFLNSSFNETPSSRKAEGAPTAMVHPADLDELKLADGALVRLGNKQGSLLVAARAFDGVQRGVVIVEGLWGNADFKEGTGINTLTSADAIPPVGGAPFHDTRVWLRAA